ncbi:MAG: light harvesting protein subunit alpha, partial [Pseudomonadota bacterium]
MSEPAAPARRAAQPPGSDGRAGVAAAVLYLGDEVAAAGWRLAGVHTLVPAPGQEAAALEEALAGARTRAAAAGPAAPA